MLIETALRLGAILTDPMGKRQGCKLFGPTHRTMHARVFAMMRDNSPKINGHFLRAYVADERV